MTSAQSHSRGLGEELTNALMIGLFALFGFAAVLRGAGSVAAFLTGAKQPEIGFAGGVNVLFAPADPATALGAHGLNAVVYWVVAVLLLGLLTTAIVWA